MKDVRIYAFLLFLVCFGFICTCEVNGNNSRYCDLSRYRTASPSDVFAIDLSLDDCDVVGEDIREFNNIYYLNITGKNLEDQSILSAFTNLIELNAEYSNLSTLEYISDTIIDLYISNSEVTDITGKDISLLNNYSFDFLELNEASKNYLLGLGVDVLVMPHITGIQINGVGYINSGITITTEQLVNEVHISYEGNIGDILTVYNEDTMDTIDAINDIYYLNARNNYLIVYEHIDPVNINNNHSDMATIHFTYIENIVVPEPEPIIPWRPVIPYYPRYEKEEEKVVEVVEVEVLEDAEEIEEEVIPEEIEDEENEELEIIDEPIIEDIPIIKDTADQGILIKIWYWIRNIGIRYRVFY